MIKEFEKYHGAALLRICAHERLQSVEQNPLLENNSSFIINDSIGVYFKYSTKRMSPWSFSFRKDHQQAIGNMNALLDQVFVVLICGFDGVACLDYSEYKQLLDDNIDENESIRVSRRTREKYGIKGTDGKLKYKIADSAFPRKLFSSSDVDSVETYESTDEMSVQ